MMRYLAKALMCLALLAMSTTAGATSVTIAGNAANGGAYTLDVVLKSGTTNTYVVTLTADLSAANPLTNGAEYIEQAEFKIAGAPNSTTATYSNVTFLSGPSGATWAAGAGALSANGCNGNNYGFVCMDAAGGGASIDGGLTIGTATSFQWKAEVTLAGGVSLAPASTWHIGVHYTDAAVQCSGPKSSRACGQANAGIISLTGGAPPIPEPTSAAVFALGALLVGAAVRKTRG